jgi:hypothetical protein
VGDGRPHPVLALLVVLVCHDAFRVVRRWTR